MHTWVKSCLQYFSILTYVFNHKLVAYALTDELENYDQDIVTVDDDNTNNYAQNNWKSTILQPHGVRLVHLWTNSLPDGYGFSKSENFQRCYQSYCYVTFGTHEDVSKYDVVAFFAHEINNATNTSMLPQRRLQNQKYVFVSIESSKRYPMLSEKVNDFFNWTWTYKLNSDLMWIPFVVQDRSKAIVAPKINVHWIQRKDMLPVSKRFQRVLEGKTRAVVWFTSECNDSNRGYVISLKKILAERYKLQLDIYGAIGCSDLQCAPQNCNELTRYYYFYLAFETSCSDDYVTEVLLPAVEYNALPIVFGCANYSQFLPDGSYLNAKTTDLEELAAQINWLIKNFDQYVQYFKWTNHYVYSRTSANPQTNIFCRMCALLHSDKIKKYSVYNNFQKWWNTKKSFHNEKNKIFTAYKFYEDETTPIQQEKTWFRKVLDSPFWKILYSFY